MVLRGASVWVVIALACGLSSAQKPALRLERTIPLPGVDGRIDHLSVDVEGNRVFVAALGHGSVEVVDVGRGKLAGEITGLMEPQGLFYFDRNHVLYVATGGDGMVRAYDGRTLAQLESIRLGDDADNVRIDHQTNKVLVGYGEGAIAFLPLDLKTGAKVEVQLPAHPESFQLSSDGSRLFVNLPHDHSIAMIDLPPLRVSKLWTSLGAQSNFPMAVGPGGRRVYVACRQPAELLELDTESGSVMQRISTVGDADDLFFDDTRKRIYVVGGEGFVDVVDATPNGRLKSIDHVLTAPGARTGLFVPVWNELLVAAPRQGPDHPARLLVYALP